MELNKEELTTEFISAQSDLMDYTKSLQGNNENEINFPTIEHAKKYAELQRRVILIGTLINNTSSIDLIRESTVQYLINKTPEKKVLLSLEIDGKTVQTELHLTDYKNLGIETNLLFEKLIMKK